MATAVPRFGPEIYLAPLTHSGVEQGKLTLDEPIYDVLPELENLQVLEGFDDAGTPQMRSAVGHVTLRQLLTHTSGFTYSFWDENTHRYQELKAIPGIIECKKATLHAPLAFDPGSQWKYGISTDWAGQAVERVTGRRIGDYLHEYLLAPLGMNDSSFVLSEEQRANLSEMHARTPDGVVPIPFEMPQEPEFQMGGGGLYSTPADYIRFLRMLLNEGTLDGAQILRSDTVCEARQNNIGDLLVTPLPSYDPVITNDVDLLSTMLKKWSLLGMLNTERTTSGREPGSLFWAGLSNIYYWVDWSHGSVGLVATQLLPFADAHVLDLFDQFEAQIHGVDE